MSDLYLPFSRRQNVCMKSVLVTPNQVGFRKSEFINWFLPYRCVAITNIYYDRQTQQCFLLTCYY